MQTIKDRSDFDWSPMDMSQLPPSYKTNSPKEKKMLQLADNFLKQYTYLYPERMPLFLHPANECGVEKFVSTTVRPTLLPYMELYEWDGCASFVSDYLTMEPLKCPIALPSSLYSPTTILKYQRGNCFDFSVLLCSMLIGAGYDAYCVHGYATREMCSLDETLEPCPLLREPQEEVAKPERDPLHGLRVHAWVLVLSGKRDIPKTFFINPFTGKSHSTTDERFLGIESVWNHRNYWVNKQDCCNGCKDLVFDLGDAVCWEVMLLESNKPLQLLADAKKENRLSCTCIDDMMSDPNDGSCAVGMPYQTSVFVGPQVSACLQPSPGQEEEKVKSMSFDMPLSWVAPIQISPREFETRYPQGRKVILYSKAKLEKWAPNLNGNGPVKRLTVYADLDRTEVVKVREWFENREDMLEMREVNEQTQLTTDYFRPGHPFHLKAHTYASLESESEHTMEFYNEARADDLQKYVENATELIEYFEGRDDFLHIRHTTFGKTGEGIHFAGTRTDIRSQPIVQIKECFHRNLEKPADEDVAERIFLITEEKIHLMYHLKDEYFTASTKDLFKAVLYSRGEAAGTAPKICISYQAGSSEKDEKPLQEYKLLLKLRREEKQLKQQVWQSKAEVSNILKTRKNEEMALQLSDANYDKERDGKRRQQQEAMKNAKEDELPQQEEQGLDYLAPFLIRFGYEGKMTKQLALRIRDECLAAYKQRLIDSFKITQARYEKAGKELQEKEQWFEKNQKQLSTEEEEEFLAYCSEAMLRIRVTESRLTRKKYTGPWKYLAFKEKLHNDLKTLLLQTRHLK